jgi:N-methylhydantoinase A
VLSAFGFLTVPVSFDFSRTIRGEITALNWAQINSALEQMERDGRLLLGQSGYFDSDVNITRTCEVHYRGQSHEITIPVPAGKLGSGHVETLQRNFVAQYGELYNYDEGISDTLPIEALTWRVRVSGPSPKTKILPGVRKDDGPAQKAKRPIYSFEKRGFVEAPVFDRYALPVGFRAEGPMVVEERESTLIVSDHAVLHVDEYLNLVITQTG